MSLLRRAWLTELSPEAARRGLAASNSAHLRLIPVMVTSKTRADITPDLETADMLGILVMTRESLESAMNRTLTHPNPDQMYEEAERSIREAAAKYQAQGSLPLSSS